jgi:hypothetical protein
METSSPQHVNSPRVEPSSAQVEILSSSGTQSPPTQTEVPASPEMNPSIQPEASSPLRVQSPLDQAETPALTEVNPPSPQPEALNLPGNASVSPKLKLQVCQGHLKLLFHQWPKKSPLNLNKTLPQFRESGMRQAHALNYVIFFFQ